MSIFCTITAAIVAARATLATIGIVRKIFGPSPEEIHQNNLELQRRNSETTLKVAQQNAEVALSIAERNAQIAREGMENARLIQELNANLQREITSAQIKNSQELARYNLLGARETAAMTAVLQARLGLRNVFLQDVMRQFPINLSPLVILENNGKCLDFALKNRDEQDIDTTKVQINNFQLNPLPLNVIIAPLHVSSSFRFKDTISTTVWENTYHILESIFTNEYSRSGTRPIALYSASWNRNVTPGQHSAEHLYYFLKDLPTVVIEPRFDGQKIRFFISSWSIGFRDNSHHRYEMEFDISATQNYIENAYQRSKNTLDLYSPLKDKPKSLENHLSTCQTNVSLYEQIKDNSPDKIGDLMPFMNFDSSDSREIASAISESLGILIATMGDVHHLLTTNTQPHLPDLVNKYFAPLFEHKDGTELAKSILSAYANCYLTLGYDAQELIPLFQLSYAKIPPKLLKNTNPEQGLRTSLKSFVSNYNYYDRTTVNDMLDFICDSEECIDVDYIGELIKFMRTHPNKFYSYIEKLQRKYRQLKGF